MNFLSFHKQFFELGCFSVHQIYAWYKDFDKNNLTRWAKQELLIKLRQGFYAFPEYLSRRDFSWYVSNRIYKPSYISLHTVLSFYGIIPEAVTKITAVSSLKTVDFENAFGIYSYQKILPELMFGYELKPFGNRNILFALPEKAILDLFYLYPFYNTENEIKELRFDEDFMENDLDLERLKEYVKRFANKELEKRIGLLLKAYNL